MKGINMKWLKPKGNRKQWREYKLEDGKEKKRKDVELCSEKSLWKNNERKRMKYRKER